MQTGASEAMRLGAAFPPAIAIPEARPQFPAREREAAKPARRSVRRALLWMVLAALAVRLAVMALMYPARMNPARDHWKFAGEAGRIARSVAEGQGYSSPYFAKTGPTAWLAPEFPLLLAGVFKIFGVYTKASALAILSLDCLLGALTCVPVFFMARWTFDDRAALWAGWIWVFFPYSIRFASGFIWDTTLSTLLMAVLFLLALKLRSEQRWPWWFGFGALAGAAAMSDPVTLAVAPFLALWVLYGYWKNGRDANCEKIALSDEWRATRKGVRAMRDAGAGAQILASRERTASPLRMLRRNARNDSEQRRGWFAAGPAALLGVILVVSPWMVRNACTFHTFIPLRSGFWFEMYCGNNADSWHWDPPDYHPSDSATEWHEYQRLGEIGYMALKKKEALAFLSAHKALYGRQTLRRIVYIWTGFWSFGKRYLQQEPFDPPNILFCTALTILAFFGLRRAWREGGSAGAMPYVIAFVFFPLVYYFTHPEDYYRRPIDPLMVALGAGALAAWRHKERVTTTPSENPPG